MTLATHDSAWTWPVAVDAYDRTEELTPTERQFLTVELPARIKGGQTESLSLPALQRLIRPLEDVFRHVEFHGYKKDALLLYLLEEIGRRAKTFWGWKDLDWIEIVERRRYDDNRLIAVAYLLCGFQALEGIGKRRHVFFRLAQRAFTPGRFREMVEEVTQGLVTLGYQKRTLRRVPLTVAKLLLSTRCGRLEGLTDEALREFQQATPSAALEHCVVALSHWLASKQIIEAQISRVGLPKDLEKPETLLSGIPPEWARLAAY